MSKTMTAKKRVSVFLAIIVVAVSAVAGVMYLHHQQSLNAAQASVGEAPSIASIPGGGNPPPSYVDEQNKQNAEQVKQAAQTDGSAFPTITRAGFIGSPEYFADQAQQKQAAQCPIDKAVNMFKPNPHDCDIANLKLARQAGVNVEELRCEACSCPALHAAGFSAGELAQTGYTAKDLTQCGYSLTQLQDAGFSAKQLREAGYTAAQLRQAGYSDAQLRQAGFNLPDSNANCSIAALQKARSEGVSANVLAQKGCGSEALIAAGYSPAEVAAAEKIAKMCNPEALKQARAEGVSATQLRGNGCGLEALKAAGYTAADLKAAGFTAQQLKGAGFSAKQLHAAGFTAAQLKQAGFTAGQLKHAGFSAAQLKAAGFNAQQLRDAGFTAAQLRKAGFTPDELRAAGFTRGDLLRAGFTPSEAGYDVAQAPTAAAVSTQNAAQNGQNNNGASASLPSINPAYDNGQVEANLRALQQQEQQQMSAQQQYDQTQEMQGQMTQQAQKLLAGWSNSTPQKMEMANPETSSAVGAGANANGANGPTGPTIKAGTIMFATLDTGANSDEPSPIMATVLTGQLKGAKMIGNFERVNQKLVLKFNLMNAPAFDKSIPVNAVAIDQNTASTAVTGNVNNHYLLRYGTLFASSFLSGISQGIIATSSQTNCFFGVICQTQPNSNLSTGEYVALGLGNTGQQYANEMGNNFNTPPTVKIPGGTGIGVLFMQDLTLPGALPSSNGN